MHYPIHFSLQRQHLLERPSARALRRVVRDLIAVQAQYEAAGGLGLNARLEGLTQTHVANALYRDRSLVKMWALRGTLHYILPEDWSLFVAVYGRWYRERVERRPSFGLTFTEREAWLYPAILEALADGPLTYRQILARLKQTVGHRRANLDEFFDSWGGILGGMCLLGYLLPVDSLGAATRVARADRWLSPKDLAPFEGTPDQALAALLRRYLHAYGPASKADFQYWSLCGAAHAPTAWASLQSQITSLPTSQSPASAKPLYALRSDTRTLKARAPDLPLRLLPKFDSVTLMHKDKSRVVDAAHYKKVYRIAAQVEATVLLDGRIAGTWRHRQRSRTLLIEVWPFRRLPRAARRQLEEEAGRVARFFGLADVALQVA